MVIYGTGGHAKVIYDCLQDQGIEVKCFFDDLSDRGSFLGKPVKKYASDLYPDEPMIIAIGDNKIRKQLSAEVAHQLGTVTHPSTVISNTCYIDPGSMVLHQATIQIDSKVGKHVIINTSASVDHDCDIQDFVHIAPNATLCGNVHVDEGTLIGAGATVIPGITIGKWCVIGAGAVVIDDVPDHTIVVGNPAKSYSNKKIQE